LPASDLVSVIFRSCGDYIAGIVDAIDALDAVDGMCLPLSVDATATAGEPLTSRCTDEPSYFTLHRGLKRQPSAHAAFHGGWRSALIGRSRVPES
jgi:hypothetical protein